MGSAGLEGRSRAPIMLQPQCLGREKRVALAHELCGVPNEEEKKSPVAFFQPNGFCQL